jgi:nucleotide-binding universal stress UspA family protein
MKTILIATDFSPAAHNACKYGIELAKAISAKVILFNAFQVSYPLAENLLIVPAMEIQESNRARLQAELNLIPEAKGVEVEVVCENGPTTSTIISVAYERKVSLIVIGMKENVPMLRKLFGSTATPLMRQTNIPLLIIPEKQQFKLPKSIALANDIDADTNISIVRPLSKLCEQLQAKIYIVRVVKKGLDEVRERLEVQGILSKAFKNVHHAYEYLKDRDNNVAKAMHEFVLDCGIDILAVIPHEHSFIDRLFIKSNSKDMLNDITVPLLILPEKTDTPTETSADKPVNYFQIQ